MSLLFLRAMKFLLLSKFFVVRRLDCFLNTCSTSKVRIKIQYVTRLFVCVCVHVYACIRVCVNASRKNMFETYRAKSTVIETEKKHVANNRRGLKFFFCSCPFEEKEFASVVR